MIETIRTYLNDFVNLFYPVVCYSCGRNLVKQEKLVCTHCHYQIPKTNFHNDPENKVFQSFWGRTSIEHATAQYYFVKDGTLQKLVHQLKYKGMKEIGHFLGMQLGIDISDVDKFKNIDLIIPVPLHPKREKQRGYNQSEWIAKGIGEVLEVEISTRNLVRTVATSTQTRKSRFERWENVEHIFHVIDKEAFIGRHILLVDDVITTGATLEACANVLLEIEGVKVSIATLGYTL